jgi:hypothetical protein
MNSDRLEVSDGRLCPTANRCRGGRSRRCASGHGSALAGDAGGGKGHTREVCQSATTDYAIMFLATEGQYAEALREPQFAEEIQQKYRVVIVGPTTLSAIVSSLRLGFQSLVVEQRAAEGQVWGSAGQGASAVEHSDPDH